MFFQSVPIHMLMTLKVMSYCVDIFQNFFNSSIFVTFVSASYWICICSKKMLSFFFFSAIFEEIPANWWSQWIQEFSLLSIFLYFFFQSITAALVQFKLMGISFIIIIFNLNSYFVLFHISEPLQQNSVFNILNNMRVNMSKRFGSIKPFLSLFFIEIVFPNPISSVLLSLFFIIFSFLLSFC